MSTDRNAAPTACDALVVRVEPTELTRIRNEVTKRGRRYGGANLEGAVMDADYALETVGFTSPEIKKPGELGRMVMYAARPGWPLATEREVVQRLETAWVEDAA